jgi:hypothetical protein
MNFFGGKDYLDDNQRKKILEHGCEYFTFKTCVDLSEPIQVIPYGNLNEFTLNQYSIDISNFICWWSNVILKDLNGVSGFNNLKFEPINFKII